MNLFTLEALEDKSGEGGGGGGHHITLSYNLLQV